MAIEIIASGDALGATVYGLSLADPPSDEVVTRIEEALEAHGVLVFPDQTISPAEQVAFSRAFAELELTELDRARLPGHEEIFVVGNVGKGLVSFAPAEEGGELEWHTDHIHLTVPARASLLYALEVPPTGGDTAFACLYCGFDALSPDEQAHAVSACMKYADSSGESAWGCWIGFTDEVQEGGFMWADVSTATICRHAGV